MKALLRTPFLLILVLATAVFGEELDPRLRELQSLPYLAWSESAVPGDAPSGVTLHNSDLSFQGFNLYVDNSNSAFLLDMDGKIVRKWEVKDSKATRCEEARLLPTGEILIVCDRQLVASLDWEGNQKWIRHIPAHHDIDVLSSGSLVVPFEVPNVPHRNRLRVTFDGIVFMSPGGSVQKWKWFYPLLPQIQARIPPYRLDTNEATPEIERSYDYLHLNSFQELPVNKYGDQDKRFRSGNYLVCFRNVSLIAIFDPKNWEIVWSYGPGVLDWPHMPEMLSNGHVLIFDNGFHRGWSRVIELDPVQNTVKWQYGTERGRELFTPRRGCIQRLPNGNTLICESVNGRAIEVTPDGRIVWEYFNPIRKDGKRQLLYRMKRYSKDFFDNLKLAPLGLN